jgi:hypothetical protein
VKLHPKPDVSLDVPDPDCIYHSTEVDAQIPIYRTYSLAPEKPHIPSFYELVDCYVLVVRPVNQSGIWKLIYSPKVGRNSQSLHGIGSSIKHASRLS